MAIDYPPTAQEMDDAFNDYRWTSTSDPNPGSRSLAAGSIWLVDDPANTNRGTVLRITMYKDQWGMGQSVSIAEPIPMGLGTSIRWDDGAGNTDKDFTEIYYAYDVYYPAGFIFPASIHMWGCKNAAAVSYAELPRKDDDESYRLFTCNLGQVNSDNGGLWPNITSFNVPNGGDHSLSNYYYNAEKIRRHKMWTTPLADVENAAHDELTYIQHKRGVWTRMEAHFKLNSFIGTTDQHDGILETWVDGTKVYENLDFPWRNADYKDYNFDMCQFFGWVGGDDVNFAASQTQHWYLDNLVISKSRITG